MYLLNKLTLKNLKLNKKRTAVTIIGILLSVALITAVAAMYCSGLNGLIDFETREKGNFHAAYYNVPSKDLSLFENNRQVADIILTKNVGYAKINSQNEYKPYAFIKAFTTSALNNLSVKLVDGRLPENENEIVIPTHLKTNGRLNLTIGESITLDVGTRVDDEGNKLDQQHPFNPSDIVENIDGKKEILKKQSQETIINSTTKTYKIVGIIERPATNIELYSAPGYTFITFMDENDTADIVDVYVRYTKKGVKTAYKTTADILGIDPDLFTKIYTGVSLSESESTKYFEQLDKSPYSVNLNSYLIILETSPIRDSGVSGLSVVVGIVLVIIIFTSVFCIKNSFDISITEKIKQYGMLRSIGATKKQIKKNVFYEAAILGIIGIPLGIALGYLASFILVIVSNYFLKDLMLTGFKLEFIFSLPVTLVALALGTITIFFSAFHSAKRASKVTAIDSIRNSANITLKSSKLKCPKIIKKTLGIGGEISYKNIKRNNKKYRTTVISIIISTSVFIGLSYFVSSIFKVSNMELSQSDYNLVLILQDKNSYENVQKATRLDNIEDYAIYRNKMINIKNPQYNPNYLKYGRFDQNYAKKDSYVTILSLGDYQYQKYLQKLNLNYAEYQDKAILYDNELLYYNEKGKNKKYYTRKYSYEPNSIINVYDNAYYDHTYETNLEIGYITDIQPFGLNENTTTLIVSDKIINEFYMHNNTLTVYYNSNNPNQLQDDLDTLLAGERYSITNIAENVKMTNSLYTLIAIFLYGFMIVISLIGITNIFNTITTSMYLRKQEFAMLKSIGMTKKEFNKMIRLESILMGIKSLVIGIPIGLAISYLIYLALLNTEGISFQAPILPIIISIIVVYLLISILMKYSLNKINKQNTIETIRNENI